MIGPMLVMKTGVARTRDGGGKRISVMMCIFFADALTVMQIR